MNIEYINIADISHDYIHKQITIRGWIQQFRNQADICFILVNDGTNSNGLQVTCTKTKQHIADILTNLNVGCYIHVNGTLVNSPAKGQEYELQLDDIIKYSLCDAVTYPLKKNIGLDTLRKYCHLRGRTKTFGCVYRIRNTIMFETHKYFQGLKYLHLDPNIITTNECEGGAGVFTATEILDRNMPLHHLPITEENRIDFTKDHFKKQTFLTVSSQLQLEALACSIGNVYTTNKSFRSEHSNTNKHASEFTHLEIEAINIEYYDLMRVGMDYIKHILQCVYTANYDDVKTLDQFVSKGLLKTLDKLLHMKYTYVSYSETIHILQENNFDVSFGCDLSSEMESFLTKDGQAVFVYQWPKSIKSFYMKQSIENEELCDSFDLLMPYGIGELIGGSMREDDYDILLKSMNQKNMDVKDLQWYVDLRKYGTVPHGGFGLGLDRLIMLCTGMKNIRDVIPFPVNYQCCKY